MRDSLEALGAGHLSGRSPFALSGGEKRRVAVAGVLAMGPEVLVLDEPTAGLDPAMREDLLGLIRGLKAAGISVVLVSHDLEEVAEATDRVYVMERGAVRAVGTPAEVFYRVADLAPATVQTVLALGEAHRGVGRPVRFRETLAALRTVAGN